MNKFWNWFQEKTGFNEFHWQNHNRENWRDNLIGHMIEYCIVHFIEFKLEFRLTDSLLTSNEEVGKIYFELERLIEEHAVETDDGC